MQLVINPKDNNTFATASLDKTIKVWQFGSSVPNFTLEGHEKGVSFGALIPTITSSSSGSIQQSYAIIQ